MIVIENGDLIEGDATSATEVDFTLHGLDNFVLKQLADGQLAAAKGTIYTADSTDVISSIILVNSGAAHNHVNLYLKPTGGTSRRLIPKDLQLEPGYSLHFDGAKVMILDITGGIVSGVNVSDVAYAATWDGVTGVAPSKNAVYDKMETMAPLNSPALVTPALGTPTSGVLSGCSGYPGLAITAGKTITCTQNITLDEAVAMSSKLTIPGAWTTPAFDAGNFTANGSMTWTVEAADVVTYAYTIMGKVMTVLFSILNATIGGNLNTALQIQIPALKTATKQVFNPIAIRDNNIDTTGVCTIDASGTLLLCKRLDLGNWSAITNGVRVLGQITFEIN